MNILKSNLGICVCVAVLGAPAAVSAQQAKNFTPPNVSGNGAITGYSPAQGGMVKRQISKSKSGSPCGGFLRKKGWKEGINNPGRRNEKTLAIGIAPVSAKITSPDYVDSRYVAFREAFLAGNGALAKALEQQIKSNASSGITTGNMGNSNEQSPGKKGQALRNKASNIKMREKSEASVGGVFNKGLRLMNALMDDELKKSGHDVDAERKAQNESNAQKKRGYEAEAKKLDEERKRLTGQRRFKEIIKASALERMKGIYTVFTSENLPADPKASAQMCVVLQYSPRSERLADMMASRDFANAPQLDPESPLTDQLPDPSTGQGVFQLVTMWGITVMVDENGDVNLVAFSQAGYTQGDENEQIAAKGRAELQASSLIRLFINQTVAVQESTKIAQSVKSYTGGLKKTELNKEFRKKLEVGGGFLPINGMQTILDWDGIHPVTNGAIAGAVVAWNASAADGAIHAKASQNRVVKDRGGVKALNNSGDGPRSNSGDGQQNRKKSGRPATRRGGMRGSTRSKDF